MNVYILLDRSRSMESLWEEALGSINGYVKGLAEDTKVYLAVFDYSYDVIRNTTAGKWVKVTREDVEPRGGTRLYDSAARIIHRAMDDNNEKSVVVIMTDGEENSSINFKKDQIKALCDQYEARNWQLVFLGADFEKVTDVATTQFGRAFDKSLNLKKEHMAKYVSQNLAASTMAYASTGRGMTFTENDRKAAEGR